MKNNPSIHGYSQEPVYESHCHIDFPLHVDKTVSVFDTVMKHFNYDKMQICCLSNYGDADKTQNLTALYIKDRLAPRVYVGANPIHHYDERDTADYYLDEIKRYQAMGCDGIKLLDGKVCDYRKLGKKMCDPVFDKFYAYAEENNIPIVSHIGDPLSCWDITKCSQYAIEKGWYCDENDPTREDLRAEVDCILEKFPKLHLVLAHFYFMSDELERAAAFLDKWENVCFDLTPGGEMFINFTKRYDDWKAFFVKYQDRIVYGTDTYNFDPEDYTTEERYGPRINLVRTYLESDEVFTENTMKTPFRGFGFSGEILDKIYRKNFVRLYGEKPRALDRKLIASACEEMLAEGNLNSVQTENLNIIKKHFETGEI